MSFRRRLERLEASAPDVAIESLVVKPGPDGARFFMVPQGGERVEISASEFARLSGKVFQPGEIEIRLPPDLERERMKEVREEIMARLARLAEHHREDENE